jgi:hypothetical protein
VNGILPKRTWRPFAPPAQPVRITVDAASLNFDELRCRLAQWCPEVRLTSDAQLRAAVEDTLADRAVSILASLRMGRGLEEASFRQALRRQIAVVAEVL